jgi:hypothetical protein
MFIWWHPGSNVYRNAVDSGDPSLIEGKLRNYHDRLNEVRGSPYFCFEDPISEEGYSDDEKNFFIPGGGCIVRSDMLIFSVSADERSRLDIYTKAAHPAFYQTSLRRKLPTNTDHKYYAFIRTAADQSERILAVLNFQDSVETVQIDCSGVSAERFVDLRINAVIQHKTEIEVELPVYGYRFFKVLPS